MYRNLESFVHFGLILATQNLKKPYHFCTYWMASLYNLAKFSKMFNFFPKLAEISASKC